MRVRGSNPLQAELGGIRGFNPIQAELGLEQTPTP